MTSAPSLRKTASSRELPKLAHSQTAPTPRQLQRSSTTLTKSSLPKPTNSDVKHRAKVNVNNTTPSTAVAIAAPPRRQLSSLELRRRTSSPTPNGRLRRETTNLTNGRVRTTKPAAKAVPAVENTTPRDRNISDSQVVMYIGESDDEQDLVTERIVSWLDDVSIDAEPPPEQEIRVEAPAQNVFHVVYEEDK